MTSSDAEKPKIEVDPANWAGFHHGLSALEADYWQRFLALFLRVDPAKPEKGCVAMIQRARAMAVKENIAIEAILARLYAEAECRTERRLALTTHCTLPPQAKG